MQDSVRLRRAGRCNAVNAYMRAAPLRHTTVSLGAVLMALGIGAAAAAVAFVSYLVNMPGKNRSTPLPALTAPQVAIRDALRRDVEMLAGSIGGRSYEKPEGLRRALEYLRGRLEGLGYTAETQTYGAAGQTFTNLIASVAGTSDEVIVVGAHYDTAGGLPGANDNASGCAAVLALAAQFAGARPRCSIRWVFFVNEEPPWFQGEHMGSRVYAARCHERKDKIAGMLSLETIGYYSTSPQSQTYPAGFHAGYPDRGDFLGFVSDVRSAPLLRKAVRTFRRSTPLPSQGAAAPAHIAGVGWSDHWSFWQFGYPAIMVTDTAPFRYPYYHTARDTPDKLDYDRTTFAVVGLAGVVRALAKL